MTTTPPYLSNRSRRCSMPATSAMYKPRNVSDHEFSHLEMTAEERGDSESDFSVANHESDEEQTPLQRLHLRLSEEMEESSNSSEQNNNTSSAMNNNNNGINEIISQRYSRENSDKSCDNSSEDIFKDTFTEEEDNQKKKKTFINIIEYHYIINLYVFQLHFISTLVFILILFSILGFISVLTENLVLMSNNPFKN